MIIRLDRQRTTHKFTIYFYEPTIYVLYLTIFQKKLTLKLAPNLQEEETPCAIPVEILTGISHKQNNNVNVQMAECKYLASCICYTAFDKVFVRIS